MLATVVYSTESQDDIGKSCKGGGKTAGENRGGMGIDTVRRYTEEDREKSDTEKLHAVGRPIIVFW